MPPSNSVVSPEKAFDLLSKKEMVTIGACDPRRKTMQVRDVMTEGAECICPSDSLQKPAERMKNLNVGVLPICCDNDRLVGMITDRDIAARTIAAACDPHTTTVKDVMLWCFNDQDVQEAARRMREN
jgi:CBS domain-containing protein